MRTKTIHTLSGAKYVVWEDGRVERSGTGIEMVFTRDGFQYTEGFLPHGDTLDTPTVGRRFQWMGVVNDYTEPISSSIIQSIEEGSE